MAPVQIGSRHVLVTVAATAAAMVAFAANSVLCRLALEPGSIDALSFSVIRLVSGAVVLVALALGTRRPCYREAGDWFSGAMLLAYALCFSLAYVDLGAGAGALILFGSVQISMVVVALARGDRPPPGQWSGLWLALGGLAYLLAPGWQAPSIAGAGLMMAAGVAWALYTLRGRGARDSVAATCGNFLRSAVLVAPLALLVLMRGMPMSTKGVVLAVFSGAITSALGYVVWYVALGGLSTTRAAAVQLTVPVIAAVGGVVLLSEAMTLRLVLATAAILGGVALVLRGRDG